MPSISQSEIRMLLFPFKMSDSAARVFVIKQRAHIDKLEKKDLMNDVDNSRFPSSL